MSEQNETSRPDLVEWLVASRHSKPFNEYTTELHQVIEDPAERQEVIDAAVVNDALEGNRGKGQQAIAKEIMRWGALMLRKNRDYGCAVWDRPMLAPECDPGVAIRVRMSDKLSRLMSLLEKGNAEVNESLDDTLRDLGAYCLLELARPNRVTTYSNARRRSG